MSSMSYGIPFGSTEVLKVDPTDDTITTFGSLAGNAKWMGGVLAPNGCVYGIPDYSTEVLKLDGNVGDVPLSLCLSMYFNKL